MGWVGLGREEREREDVGRAAVAHVGDVEAGELGVVREHQADGGGLGGAAGQQGGPEDPGQPRGRDEPGHARPDLEIHPERREVERPEPGGGRGSGSGRGHAGRQAPGPEAVRRASSSTTLFPG